MAKISNKYEWYEYVITSSVSVEVEFFFFSSYISYHFCAVSVYDFMLYIAQSLK